jgi:zinc/manganese transport system substrate-binding protein
MRLVLVALSLSLLLGCEPATARPSNKLKVLTSILPVYCFTANVAGDLAVVESVLSSGADAHDFQFTPKERRQFDGADLIIVNGLKMEGWLGRAVKQSQRSRPVVECSSGLESQLLQGSAWRGLGRDTSSQDAHDGHSHLSSPNPHLWLDPGLAARMVTNILVALQKADPANADGYSANAAAFVARLQKLDGDIRSGLASITNRNIVTYHDAFPYFARRYGLKVAGVIEESPDVAPTPRYLASLRQAITTHDVKAIFTEPQHSDKLARQFAADLKLRVAPLDTLEVGDLKLTAYEDGMRRNLRSLQDALK